MSLPESQKQANSVDEKDKCANGPQDDAAVDKETPNTAGDQQQSPADQEAPANHTTDHTQSSTAAPEEVELKITEEPDRSEPETAPAAETPEQPSTTPPTDTDVENDQNKPSAEVLFVSEDGDVMRTKTEPPMSEAGTDQHAQTTCTAETTEVHTTTVDGTQTSVQKDETQQEVVEQSRRGAGDDVIAPHDVTDVLQMQTTLSVEAAAATDEAGQAAATMSGGTGDMPQQAAEDTDAVVKAPADEVSAAAGGVDQPEPSAASEQGQPGDTEAPGSQETAASFTDAAPTTSEQPDAEQHVELPTPPAATEVTSGAVDAPAAASAGVLEQSLEEPKYDETSVEAADEQPVHPQQQPASDDVEPAAVEQMPPPAGITDVEAPAVSAGETPAEVTALAHEERQTAAVEETNAPATDVETTNTPTTTAESTSTSSDTAQPGVDETASKPEDAATSSAEVAADVQPEELPPPLSPDSEEASAPGHEDEIHQQAQSNDWHVESPSEQPDQQHAVNGSVEEPATTKTTSETAEHVDEQLPVTGEP